MPYRPTYSQNRLGPEFWEKCVKGNPKKLENSFTCLKCDFLQICFKSMGPTFDTYPRSFNVWSYFFLRLWESFRSSLFQCTSGLTGDNKVRYRFFWGHQIRGFVSGDVGQVDTIPGHVEPHTKIEFKQLGVGMLQKGNNWQMKGDRFAWDAPPKR